ncbi:lipocalin family protein [Hymenobacter nivis]|uniref:Lipocalin-like domain-containing protein n=1 Tax=Hymenobacter nivis TaxID=1850093 RepID=A0A502HGV9_9BACT|nr:lipocalin family protein [Hymenobacter nivis]TPG72410.1 hypothetical protein EAH73_04065 [Hymenobacter nivis]
MKKACFFLLIAAVFSSCKKSGDDTAPSAELLTSKKWRLSADAYTDVAGGTATTTNAYATLPACKRDDYLMFNADKSLTTDEGPTRCSTTLPQTLTGTWSISADQAKLTSHTVGYSSFILHADVVELSATALHLRTVTNIYPATTRTEDFTYTAL